MKNVSSSPVHFALSLRSLCHCRQRSRRISPEKVQKIKTAGLEVGAWTVNDQAMMIKLLKIEVRRLYTDYPRTLLSLKTK